MSINTARYSFTEANINQWAPNYPGIYALYDHTYMLIYYGRSDVSIKRRLLDHCMGKEGKCTQQATSFNWEQTTAPVTREKQLLQEFQNYNGRLPKCNSQIG